MLFQVIVAEYMQYRSIEPCNIQADGNIVREGIVWTSRYRGPQDEKKRGGAVCILGRYARKKGCDEGEESDALKCMGRTGNISVGVAHMMQKRTLGRMVS